MIGYASGAADDQCFDLQLDALDAAGCNRVFEDHGESGNIMARPGLSELLRSIRPGQTLVVWRFDRLGLSLTGLVSMIDDLGKRGIHFQSLSEQVSTSSSGGQFIFSIIAALAEFERSLISERTKAGMATAKSMGRPIGRPPSLSEDEAREILFELETRSVREIAEERGVSARTLKRSLKKLQ